MSCPPFITDYDLVECIDLIDDCLWGEWTVNITLPGGEVMEGCSVQSDGHLIEWSTLTDDAGNPLYNRLAERWAKTCDL